MLSVKSLRVDYENITAVHDLNLQINKGQIYGLVGPNGAGKTSTLKALAGILDPTYGEIKIENYDFEIDFQNAIQLIGFMPDFPSVYENLKVWEYLEVFGAAYLIGREERLKRAKHWITEVNLMDKWDTLVRELSRGMRQRLVLAKTLLHEPSLLLLDEPASGLDPIARKELRNVLKKIADEGKTIIISSHILTELSDFCNAIGVMEKGVMVVSGSISEIRDQIGSKGILRVKINSSDGKIIEKAKKVLEDSQQIQKLNEITENHFESQFKGDEDSASKLLAELIKKKIPISNFRIVEEDVEDIFFKIGAKEVS